MQRKITTFLLFITFGQALISQPHVSKLTAEQAVEQIQTSMLLIPGGNFMMGCSSDQGKNCFENEKPAHEVQVSDFYMNKFEVTQEQWLAIMGNNPCRIKGCTNCPVEMVTWEDAQKFINKINKISGRTYRMPTEAEWEYAARGGEKVKKYAGSNKIRKVAYYKKNSKDRQHTVGTKLANGYGLYDMTGNVWEWCSDTYKNYPGNYQKEETGDSCHILRGGSFSSTANECRNSMRGYTTPGYYALNIGFRLALTK